MVTGCAGMIGARVTDRLLADGVKVVGVDILNDAYDIRLKDWRMERLMGTEGFEFHKADISDEDAMDEIFSGAAKSAEPTSTVINLAARAGVRQSIEDPAAYYEANLMGTLSLLRMCASYDVPKFVLSSTSSVYGLAASTPTGQLSVDLETSQPLSPYAASKKAAEALAYTYHHLYGLDVSILRYFTVYGPAGRPDMSLFRFVQKISEGRPITVFGDGSQSRDFTFVDDVAAATIASTRPIGYEIMNVGSDSPIVLSDAISVVEELTGHIAKIDYQPMHPADVTATWADISKTKRLLDWEPKTSFSDGLVSLVKWYQENRDWAQDVVTDD
jgi:nucleoside-diphosphate-sugar epimerase